MSVFEVYCTACGSVNVRLSPTRTVDGRFRISGCCQDCKIQDNLSQGESPAEFVMPFGKHKGKTIAEIVALDRNYAEWVTIKSDIREPIKNKFIEAMG